MICRRVIPSRTTDFPFRFARLCVVAIVLVAAAGRRRLSAWTARTASLSEAERSKFSLSSSSSSSAIVHLMHAHRHPRAGFRNSGGSKQVRCQESPQTAHVTESSLNSRSDATTGIRNAHCEEELRMYILGSEGAALVAPSHGIAKSCTLPYLRTYELVLRSKVGEDLVWSI